MKPALIFLLFTGMVILFASLSNADDPDRRLKKKYARNPRKWPTPNVAPGVEWKELDSLPLAALASDDDSLREVIQLGKLLFFDTRLSGSGKISCATCHQPELSWADGIGRSIGHEGSVNKRNAPTLLNVWFYKRLFWDGRSSDLEDQAFAPINSETEMHQEMQELPFKLRRTKSYPALFETAFGSAGIDPDRIASALAAFQRTLRSQPGRFDAFLRGDRSALSNQEIRGLHIFRTKAGCMNCHHGPLFTDNRFHNNGFANGDPGLFAVTHLSADSGKMKTPSLRDVTRTGPWMHDGAFTNLPDVLHRYNNGIPAPNKDLLLHPIKLPATDIEDLLAFLKTISNEPPPFQRPVLPE